VNSYVKTYLTLHIMLLQASAIIMGLHAGFFIFFTFQSGVTDCLCKVLDL